LYANAAVGARAGEKARCACRGARGACRGTEGLGAAAAVARRRGAGGGRHHPDGADDQGGHAGHPSAAGDAGLHVQHPRDAERAALEAHRLQHRGRADPAGDEMGRHAGAEGVPARACADPVQAALRRDLVADRQVLRDLRSEYQVDRRHQRQAPVAWAAQPERLGRVPAADPRRPGHHPAEHGRASPDARTDHAAADRRRDRRRRHRVRHGAEHEGMDVRRAAAPARGLGQAPALHRPGQRGGRSQQQEVRHDMGAPGSSGRDAAQADRVATGRH